MKIKIKDDRVNRILGLFKNNYLSPDREYSVLAVGLNMGGYRIHNNKGTACWINSDEASVTKL